MCVYGVCGVMCIWCVYGVCGVMYVWFGAVMYLTGRCSAWLSLAYIT